MSMQSSLCYIFFLANSSVYFIRNHACQKCVGRTGSWDRNLSNARVRLTLVLPRGDISSAICGPLQDSCCCLSWKVHGPCLAQSHSLCPAHRLSPQLFLKQLEFNQNINFYSILLKPNAGLHVFYSTCPVMREVLICFSQHHIPDWWIHVAFLLGD